MTKVIERTLKCPCGSEYEARMYVTINLERNPELGSAIESGRINCHKCPKCGRNHVGMMPRVISPSERAEKQVRGEATVKYEW